MKEGKKLPDGWKEVELREVCEIKKGHSITENDIINESISIKRVKEEK